MGVLTAAAFISKWNSRFADNTTRDISEEDERDFATDIKDSFGNLTDLNYIFTPQEIAGNASITTSGHYVYTGTGGHTFTISDSLKLVQITNESSNGSGLTLSGNIIASFGTIMFAGNGTTNFKWTSFLSKYIY